MDMTTHGPSDGGPVPPFPPILPQPPPLRPSAAAGPPLYYQSPFPQPRPQTIYHQAAKASWVAPIITVVLGFLTSTSVGRNGDTATLVVAVLNVLLLLLGLVFGVFALFGVRRHGKPGILAPAVVGVCINGSLIVLMAVSVLLLTQFARMASAARRSAVAAAPT